MISDDAIMNLLKPHFEFITDIHEDGLKLANKVTDLVAEHNCKLQKRYKTGITNNYVTEIATPHFKKVPGIKVDNKYDSLVLYFDAGFISRFKKKPMVFNKPCKSSTRNINFIQGILYESCEPSIAIEIIYDINEVGSEIERIQIIKRVDKIPVPIGYIYNNQETEPKTFKALEAVLGGEQDEQISIKSSS